jgi:haloacetate dehalogenase
MFEGFQEQTFQVSGGVTIYAKVAGAGPGLLLLHGFPQTHVCWHKIAPALTTAFTVVLPDLRGYGASSKPEGAPDHANYCKRTMAGDQMEVMQQLGFDRFCVVGHDRGGRVAHRMALDYGKAVERLAVIDIAPTATMYAATDRAFAEAYYHWFFLTQPRGFPERLIGADPEYYLRHTLRSWCKVEGAITLGAFEAYLQAFREPEAIHAACEDYRASAAIDLVHDADDEVAGNKISAPVCVIWGSRGTVGQQFDVVATWREKAASTVEGTALDCGHFVPEEDPAGLLKALKGFLDR